MTHCLSDRVVFRFTTKTNVSASGRNRRLNERTTDKCCAQDFSLTFSFFVAFSAYFLSLIHITWYRRITGVAWATIHTQPNSVCKAWTTHENKREKTGLTDHCRVSPVTVCCWPKNFTFLFRPGTRKLDVVVPVVWFKWISMCNAIHQKSYNNNDRNLNRWQIGFRQTNIVANRSRRNSC